MKCAECKGACCESFSLPVEAFRVPGSDEWRWVALHAKRDEPRSLEFECRCTALTKDGRCGIYADRPLVCRAFLPGGFDCLDTVRKRRTAEEYRVIRDEGDPVRIHP